MLLSKEEIQNLSELFLSKDDANTQLAFEIMKPHGFISELMTEIFVVYKLTKSDPLREKATLLLNEYGSSGVKAAMDRRLEFKTEKTIKKNIVKYVQTSDNELDGLKFAKALYNKYDLGFAYLMKEASSDEKRAILAKHKEGTSFLLQNKGLTAMPNEFFEFTDLEEIDISSNKLSSISSKFKVFKNLKKLNASSNCLKKIHKNLASLTNLEELDLSNNLIEEFPEVLGEIKSLKRLKLESMLNISGLVRGIAVPANFSNLKLNFLGLSSDPLNRNKHGFSKWPYLGNLETEGDDFIDLTPLAMAKMAFEKGETSTIYYLLYHAESDYKKKVLERCYDAATKTMNLSEMYIKSLPDELEGFDIRILNMNGASIQYNFKLIDDINVLFKPVGKLSNIEEIYLRDNGLGEIPLPIFQCSKLRILDISGNRTLDKVPTEIQKLTALEHLNLENTNSSKCMEFPDEIQNLKALKTLRIDYVSRKTEEEINTYKKRLDDLFGERVALNRYGQNLKT